MNCRLDVNKTKLKATVSDMSLLPVLSIIDLSYRCLNFDYHDVCCTDSNMVIWSVLDMFASTMTIITTITTIGFFFTFPDYFCCVSNLSQLSTLARQLHNDSSNPSSHKYIAHQLALLYVSTSLSYLVLWYALNSYSYTFILCYFVCVY